VKCCHHDKPNKKQKGKKALFIARRKRRSRPFGKSQMRLVASLIFIALAADLFRWLEQHWWIVLPFAAGGGYMLFRRWKRRRDWFMALRLSGIEDIDRMSGQLFEQRLKLFFNDRGWRVELTPSSGDYGADLVGRDNAGQRVVIQAKRYQSAVGVHAIQEVLGGKAHYGASRALVITNSGYSANAYTLAEQAGVELWDRTRLIKELADGATSHRSRLTTTRPRGSELER
jgi:restriction system protein